MWTVKLPAPVNMRVNQYGDYGSRPDLDGLIGEGTVVAQGSGYTLSDDDAQKFRWFSDEFFIALDSASNALTLTKDAKNLSITRGGVTEYFASLSDAFHGARDGETITVGHGYTEYANAVMPDKTLTLDIGAYIVTAGDVDNQPSKGGSAIQAEAGRLTLTGSAGGYTGDMEITGGYAEITGGTYQNIILGPGGEFAFSGGKIEEMLFQAGGTLSVSGGTVGLLYAYAGTSRLSGGTFTGINIPQEAVLNGKGIIYLADSEAAARTAMEGMPAAGKKFDQAVLTAADPAPMAYCPGPVSIVNDSATSSSGGSSYSPILEKTENGAASFSPKRPKRGDEVTITPAPDEGYQVAEIIVTGNSGEKIKVTDNADGTYRFTQPRGRVTVHMVFRKIRAAEACLRDGTCPIRTFTDADVNAWYHDGVHYCLENGLMAGTGATPRRYQPGDDRYHPVAAGGQPRGGSPDGLCGCAR